MNKSDVLRNAIILPLAVGIALAIAFCLFFNSNVDKLLPVPNGTALAYHDVINSDSEAVDKTCLKDNDLVGTLQFEDTRLNVCYNANYSSLVSSLSFEEGSKPFGEIGCAYLKTTSKNAKQILTSKKFVVDSIYGKFNYELCNELKFDNEFEAKCYAPRLPKSLVIYYQASNGAGLSSGYNALVLKEVG